MKTCLKAYNNKTILIMSNPKHVLLELKCPLKAGIIQKVIPFQQLSLSPEDSGKSQTERKGKEIRKGALK